MGPVDDRLRFFALVAAPILGYNDASLITVLALGGYPGIFLIGGAPRVGKTILAQRISARLGIG